MTMRNRVPPDDLLQCGKGGLVNGLAGKGAPGVTLEPGQPGLSWLHRAPVGGESEHLIIYLVVAVPAPDIEQDCALASPAVEQARGRRKTLRALLDRAKTVLDERVHGGQSVDGGPPEVGQHEAGSRVGRTDHAGDAGARVRAGADEVEAADAIVAVVDPEVCALSQHRLE